MPTTSGTAIERYDPARYNILLPTPQLRQQLGAWHVLTVSEVPVNPDPAAGDVYPLQRDDDEQAKPGAKFALAKPALNRIAVAGGIIWDPRHSGYDRLDDYVAAYRAVGYLRMPDGSILPLVATKIIDLRVISSEERQRLERKAAKDEKLKGEAARQRWIDRRLDAVMMQWRKNYAARAETGAMLRVTRAAFGLKAGYTQEELERPFVVPRIDFSPDMSDPEVRRFMLARGTEALRAFAWSPAQAFGLPARPADVGPTRPALPAPEIDEGSDDEDPSTANGQDGIATSSGTAPATPVTPAPAPAAESASATPAAASPTVQETAPAASDTDDTKCARCGRTLSPKVRAYSLEHFGEPLCMQHQPRRGVASE